MILWYFDELMKEHQVIGQVSIPMGLFKEQPPVDGNRNPSTTDPQLVMFEENIINVNSVVGKIGIKMQYSIVN